MMKKKLVVEWINMPESLRKKFADEWDAIWGMNVYVTVCPDLTDDMPELLEWLKMQGLETNTEPSALGGTYEEHEDVIVLVWW